MKPLLLIALALSALALPGVVQSQTPEEIVQKLTPKEDSLFTSTPGYRKPLFGSKNDKGIEVSDEDELPSVNFNVPFEFDSDRLSSNAYDILRNLGVALNDKRLLSYRFRISGYTDAKGTLQYNQDLSERRAKAVAAYLMSVVKLEGSRLETAGYGKTRLLDSVHPESEVNRRVEVQNLGE
jgi:outer membrane protein OmpA-like peptidoglycan-associated protein